MERLAATPPENYIKEIWCDLSEMFPQWGAVGTVRKGPKMPNIVAIGRMGLLGVGLGIGAAVGFTTATASADPALDPNLFSLPDGSAVFSDLPTSALADPPNIAINIDGISLLSLGTATAQSDFGDTAIAYGDNAHASATGGFFDFASASGAGSTAVAANGNFDLATDSAGFSAAGGTATAGDGSFDLAQASGLDGVATADEGSFDNAFSLTGNSGEAVAAFGNGDSATNIGDGSALAGGTSATLLGNFDIADNFGSLQQAMAGASDTASGSYDLAAILAQGTPDATATGGNFLVEILPSLF